MEEVNPRPEWANYEPIEKLSGYIVLGFDEKGNKFWIHPETRNIVVGEMN